MIRSIGQVGFQGTSINSTALSQVILDLNFNSTATNCSCNNYDGLNVSNFSWNPYYWSSWNDCRLMDYWVINSTLLNDSISDEKYVRCIIDHDNSVKIVVNDSITYSPRGAGLDTTVPSDFEILMDRDYISFQNVTKIKFNWTRSYDFESEYLKIPLIYYFRIRKELLNVTDWVLIGTQNYVDLDLYDIILNQSIEFFHNETIIFEIKVVNSAGLFTISQKNLSVDNIFSQVTGVSAFGISEDEWYSRNSNFYDVDQLYFNWSAQDVDSGVYCYSFILTNDVNESPDYVCDGPIGNFDIKTNHIYTNLRNRLEEGINYFKVLVIDNAGNIGPVEIFEVKIDNEPPATPLVYDQGLLINNSLSENIKKGIIFNWTNYDTGCGVVNHYVEVDDSISFNNPEFSDYTNSSLNYFNFSTFKDGIYYIRVKAIDCMGYSSSFSDVTKTIKQSEPLLVYDYGPRGDVLNKNPYLFVETSKDAECFFRNAGFNNYTAFGYTGTEFHNHKLRLDYASYNFEILCNDTIGNEKIFNVDFSIREDFYVSTVLIKGDNSVYQGENLELDLNVLPQVSQLEKSDFEFFIDDKKSDNFVVTETQGIYTLFFEVPLYEDDVELDVYMKVLGQKSNVFTVNTYKPRLVVSFDDDLVRYNKIEKSDYENIVFFKDDNFSFGISSLGRNDVDISKFEVSSGISNEYYLFLTDLDFDFFRREDSLYYGTFSKLINPSFGFRIETDDFLYRLILKRDDSDFYSDYDIGYGKKSLLLQNTGKTASGKKKIFISSNKFQNVSEGDLIAR